MARFQIVRYDDSAFTPKWTIEEVIPGEKPIPLPFIGTRAEAEAELSRLNLYGKKGRPAAGG
jgi:hypothetical protein